MLFRILFVLIYFSCIYFNLCSAQFFNHHRHDTKILPLNPLDSFKPIINAGLIASGLSDEKEQTKEYKNKPAVENRPNIERENGNNFENRPNKEKGNNSFGGRPNIDNENGPTEIRPNRERENGNFEGRPNRDRENGPIEIKPNRERENENFEGRPNRDRENLPNFENRPNRDRDNRPDFGNKPNQYDYDKSNGRRPDYEYDRDKNNGRRPDYEYDRDKNNGRRPDYEYDRDKNNGQRPYYENDRDKNNDRRPEYDSNQNERPHHHRPEYESERPQRPEYENERPHNHRPGYENDRPNGNNELGNRFRPNNQDQQPEPPVSKCRFMSKTTVNGNNVCRGDLIFEEKFQILDPNRWTTEVKLSGPPDFEFVTYMNHSDNINVRRNRLFLKPTLASERFGENFINDEINLDRACTGIPGTTDCNRKALSFQILPPIISSRVHTKQSFSFRYGKIEILAKLPKGDWIYPELYLVPKTFAYGPDYDSGQMRIAFTYGNPTFGKELHGGFILGNSDEARNHGIAKTNNTEGLWSDNYHNYTLKWTPDGVSVGVDGFTYGNLVPPVNGFSSLANVLKTNAGKRWSEGEHLAPLDKEMYLMLGVGVGGHNFPDLLPGKPWKNTSPKNVLLFWNDKDKWYSTWGSDSAMRVDAVKIWAL